VQRQHDPRVAIVGAGAAGLAGLQVLRDAGFRPDLYERTDRVGGHWHTDYRSLHLITSRDVSGFAGFPMPDDYPVYPSRAQMCAYLEAYADHHGLRDHITFDTEVTALVPTGGPQTGGRAGWELTAGGRTRTYDAVVVANGHLWQPALPQVPGRFAGTSLHSSQYQDAGDLTGEHVLVVGAGNSGCDLAVDAATSGVRTMISIRSGRMIQPKAIFGRPRAELRWLSRLPMALQERITRALIGVVLGPHEAYRGLPVPSDRNLHHHPPVVTNLLPYWIQHGRIEVVPEVERLDGHEVRFVDGTTRRVDTILWATGFEVRFPFLDDSLLTWQDGVPLRIGAMTVPLGLERLFLLGLAAPRGPQLPVYSAQAHLIARFLRLLTAADVPLAATLAAGGELPDARIDILRPLWQRQLDQTTARVARIERRMRAAAPVSSRGSEVHA
jgi:cation diffusion facilitator CzcD-associated flavoprotein CzcO